MANQRLHRLILLRKWTKRDWAVFAATTGLAIFIISFSLFSDSPNTTFAPQALNPSTPLWVPLTLVRNAKERGAFCLDGSSPGYHFQKGFGSGSNNWILHIEVDHSLSQFGFSIFLLGLVSFPVSEVWNASLRSSLYLFVVLKAITFNRKPVSGKTLRM